MPTQRTEALCARRRAKKAATAGAAASLGRGGKAPAFFFSCPPERTDGDGRRKMTRPNLISFRRESGRNGVIGTGGAEQSRGACYLVGGTEPATTESGSSRMRRLAGTQPSLSHHRGGGGRGQGAAMATASRQRHRSQWAWRRESWRWCWSPWIMDAARQRLGGEN